MPDWGGDMSGIDFQNIFYFIRSSEKQSTDWNDVPARTSRTRSTGWASPRPSRSTSPASSAQYESEVVYHSLREDLEKKGVIFCDTDTALREHEDIFREHWATVIPPGDNKLAALNSAVWSRRLVHLGARRASQVEIPLQAYFRINAENMGQFERTLIICEPGSFVHYVEGCTAPIYTTDSLHSAVVEIIVKEGARCRYTTIQNWSTNVYNLVTKRAVAHEERHDGVGRRQPRLQADHEVPGRLDGRPGRARRGALGGHGQRGDAPGRRRQDGPRRPRHVLDDHLQVDLARRRAHELPRPGPGRAGRQARQGRRWSATRCSSTRTAARTPTPTWTSARRTASIGHEATVSKVADDQIFYLMSRGLSEEEAMAMIVRGFIEPIAKELPMEYAVELNRLIELQMEGSIG